MREGDFRIVTKAPKAKRGNVGGIKSGTKDTPARRQLVLDSLAQAYSFTHACNAAGIGTTTLQEWRAKDKAFNAAVLNAVESGTDLLEDELHRRAHKGVERDIYYQGQRVGSQQEYSDRLMELAVKARRPAKYRERTEVSGPDGGPIQQQTSLEIVFVAAKRRAAPEVEG